MRNFYLAQKADGDRFTNLMSIMANDPQRAKLIYHQETLRETGNKVFFHNVYVISRGMFFFQLNRRYP